MSAPRGATPFSDVSLSRRLERAEGYACAQFAEARKRVFADCGSEWIECGGAYSVFDGIDSPITQTFGLGMFEEVTEPALEKIERFFFERGAAVHHEVSPFVGVEALAMLARRGYLPSEVSSVMYRPVEPPATKLPDGIAVRVIDADEARLWSEINARGWSHDHPEFREFLLNFGAVLTERKNSPCFLAEIDGVPGAAGALSIHEGVALFAGAATVPEFRRRGLQAALLSERMRYAAENGCDLAMMVVLPGSESQRNGERNGFRIAYTRTKWKLQESVKGNR